LQKDVGPALVSACDYTDAMHLAKASEFVHRVIFVEQNKLSGHFDRDSVVDYVPRCLVGWTNNAIFHKLTKNIFPKLSRYFQHSVI
jgi:hypothetical protein